MMKDVAATMVKIGLGRKLQRMLTRKRSGSRLPRTRRQASTFLRRTRGFPFLAVPGGYLVYRAVRSRNGSPTGVSVERTVTVNRPAAELYAYWRDFEHLPRFMDHLDSVRSIGGGRSHWVAKGPVWTTIEWDAEITQERPNELIAWRSLPGTPVPNTGVVHFAPAPGGRGTEVQVRLAYDPPAGKAGMAVAKLFGEEPDQQVREDLRRFKHVMEAGEVPTTEGQPSGKTPKYPDESPKQDEKTTDTDWRPAGDDLVDEASEESFPASDPPSYTTGQRDE